MWYAAAKLNNKQLKILGNQKYSVSEEFEKNETLRIQAMNDPKKHNA